MLHAYSYILSIQHLIYNIYLELVCDPHRLGELLNLGQGVGARAEDEDEGLGAGGVSVADITH